MDNEFEWDGEKAATNLKKHHMSFELACRVFDDDLGIELPDTGGFDENRFIRMGAVAGVVIVVSFTYRDDVVRLISARKASDGEQKRYREHR